MGRRAARAGGEAGPTGALPAGGSSGRRRRHRRRALDCSDAADPARPAGSGAGAAVGTAGSSRGGVAAIAAAAPAGAAGGVDWTGSMPSGRVLSEGGRLGGLTRVVPGSVKIGSRLPAGLLPVVDARVRSRICRAVGRDFGLLAQHPAQQRGPGRIHAREVGLLGRDRDEHSDRRTFAEGRLPGGREREQRAQREDVAGWTGRLQVGLLGGQPGRGLPVTSPVAVSAVASSGCAIPKSIRTGPRSLRMTLPGLRSRWVIRWTSRTARACARPRARLPPVVLARSPRSPGPRRAGWVR